MEIVSLFPSCPVCRMGLPWLLSLKEAMEVYGLSRGRLFELAATGRLNMTVERQGFGFRYHMVIFGVRNFPRKVHNLLAHIDWDRP